MFILGSGSAARYDLMVSVGLEPDKILKPAIDERTLVNENPVDYVKRMALEKSTVLEVGHNELLLTADTIVVASRKILHKTFDVAEAGKHLETLSNRRHAVFTSFCIKWKGSLKVTTVRTVLKMRKVCRKEITQYLKSDEWRGKAGGYSIQGKAKCFFPFISGCYSNVVGLPIPKFINVLKGIGYQDV